MITTVAAVISAATIAVAAAICRSCVIGIENGCCGYSLANPKFWMYSGYNDNPPSSTVNTQTTDICSFSQTAGAARGAVGVLTYDLLKLESSTDELNNYNSNELIAVMFSVPFDYNFYDNWLAVGIFDHNQPCDSALFDLMYNGIDLKFRRAKAKDGSVVYQGKSVNITATMSNKCVAVVKVKLNDEC
ncbi:bryoporin-like [Chanos chanos]|uniref:Bryoporin-like n=1 Tax=Chanos chanos TaxID=29144 RepID=A0A6J2UR19_CHACN|nr:bryoporin-like [Chanos chanos]